MFGLHVEGNAGVCGCDIGTGGLDDAPLDVSVMCVTLIKNNVVSDVTIQQKTGLTVADNEYIIGELENKFQQMRLLQQ